MKKSYYLNKPEGKMIFVMAMIFTAANILLKGAIAAGVYILLTGYASLDAKRLAAIIIGMMVSEKFSIRFNMKEG